MGQPTKIERLKKIIGHFAWKVFIWAQWDGDELAFQNARDEDALNYAESQGNIIRL